jgi:hypothetical protein
MTPEDDAIPQGRDVKPDSRWRAQLSNLYGLFAISMTMFDAAKPRTSSGSPRPSCRR